VDHLSEETIERYLLEPNRLASLELEDIYAHLKDCPRCRSVHDFLKDFHARLSAPETSMVEFPTVRSDQKKPFAKPIILNPMKEIPDFIPGPEARVTVLAAETTTASTHRFITKAALVSEKDKLLLRIIQDRQDNRYRVYLIADNEDRVRNAKVSIPALGVDLETNEHGIAEFVLAASQEEPDWNTLQAVLAS
jgi:hypothetical protein